MKLSIVSVFDSAAGAFARPFFVPSVGLAVRSFRDEVNRAAPDNPMHAHPDDFVLFELGELDDNTGLITPLPAPVSIARAKDQKE